MKTRENRGEKPRHSKIRTTQFSGAKFAPPTPFVRIHFCEHFPTSMLSVPTQNLSAKMHRNANLVRNCLYDYFPKRHALDLGKPQECENFRTTQHLVRNSHFFFKSHFLFFKSKLVLLQFSQHLSSDHPFPSTRSSPSSSPIPNPTMAAHLKSFIPQPRPSLFTTVRAFHFQLFLLLPP